VVASFAGSVDYTSATSSPLTFTITPAPLSVTAADAARAYGQPNPAFTVTYSGFVNGDTASSLDGSLSDSTPATASSPVGTYPITPSGLTSPNYTITFVNGSLTVIPATLTASGVDIQAKAGVRFSGTVATFSNADPFGGVTSYTATINWGDGHSSTGIITDQGSGVFAVRGSHRYREPNSYTIRIFIHHKLGDTTPADASGTATVTRHWIGGRKDCCADVDFWFDWDDQPLVKSFTGGAQAITQANGWAATFPNLFGAAVLRPLGSSHS
jgi:hypothetical protein